MKMSIRRGEGRTIIAQARGASADGPVGDVVIEIAPEQTVGGIPYDMWAAHVGETVEMDDLLRSAAAPVR